MRALLQQNLRQCPHQIKSLAYRTYVRPILEYASAVWSPCTKADKYKLEMSQRKAARFVYNHYSSYSSVTNMLQQLNWESLEHRRIKATIIMFYKIINNIVSVNFPQHFQHLTTRTRGHHLFQQELTLTTFLFYQEPSASGAKHPPLTSDKCCY